MSDLISLINRAGNDAATNRTDDVPVSPELTRKKAADLFTAFEKNKGKIPLPVHNGSFASSYTVPREHLNTLQALENSSANVVGKTGRGLYDLASEDKAIPTAIDSVATVVAEAPSRFASLLANLSGDNAADYRPADALAMTAAQDLQNSIRKNSNEPVKPTTNKEDNPVYKFFDDLAEYKKDAKTTGQFRRDDQLDVDLAAAGDSRLGKAVALAKANIMNPSAIVGDTMDAAPSIAMAANPVTSAAFIAGTASDKMHEGIKEREKKLQVSDKRRDELYKRFHEEIYDENGEVREGQTELTESEMAEMIGKPDLSPKQRSQAGSAATISTMMDFFGDKIVLGAIKPTKGVTRAGQMKKLVAAYEKGPAAVAAEMKSMYKKQAVAGVVGSVAKGAAGEAVAEFGADYYEQISKNIDNKVSDINQSWKAAAAGSMGGVGASGTLSAIQNRGGLIKSVQESATVEGTKNVTKKAGLKLRDVISPTDDYGKRIRQLKNLPEGFTPPTEKYKGRKGKELPEGYNPFIAAEGLLGEAKELFSSGKLESGKQAVQAGKEYHHNLASHYNNAIELLEAVNKDPNVDGKTKKAYSEAAGSILQELKRTDKLLTGNAIEVLQAEIASTKGDASQSEKIGKVTEADKEAAKEVVLKSLGSTELSTATLDDLLKNDTIAKDKEAVAAINAARKHAEAREALDTSIEQIGKEKTSTQVSQEYRYGNPKKAGHLGVEDYLAQADVFAITGNTAGLQSISNRLNNWLETGAQYEARSPLLKNLRETERAYVGSALERVNSLLGKEVSEGSPVKVEEPTTAKENTVQETTQPLKAKEGVESTPTSDTLDAPKKSVQTKKEAPKKEVKQAAVSESSAPSKEQAAEINRRYQQLLAMVTRSAKVDGTVNQQMFVENLTNAITAVGKYKKVDSVIKEGLSQRLSTLLEKTNERIQKRNKTKEAVKEDVVNDEQVPLDAYENVNMEESQETVEAPTKDVKQEEVKEKSKKSKEQSKEDTTVDDQATIAEEVAEKDESTTTWGKLLPQRIKKKYSNAQIKAMNKERMARGEMRLTDKETYEKNAHGASRIMLAGKTFKDLVTKTGGRGILKFKVNEDSSITSNLGVVTSPKKFVETSLEHIEKLGDVVKYKNKTQLENSLKELHSRMAMSISPVIKGQSNPRYVWLNEQVALKGGLHTEYLRTGYDNPLSMLLAKKDPKDRNSAGVLDPTIQAAVFLSAMQWIEDTGIGEMNRDIDGIKRLFGLEDSAIVPRDIHNKYRHLGTLRKLVADDIGKAVVNTLGIKLNDHAIPVGFKEGLYTSFGLYALRMLENAGVVENIAIDGKEYNDDVASIDDSKVTGESEGRSVNFVRVVGVTEGKGNYRKPSEFVSDFVKPLKDVPNLVSGLLSNERFVKRASTKPNINKNKDGDRLDTQIPNKLSKQVEEYQKTPFQTIPSMRGLLENPKAKELLMQLSGLADFDSSIYHEDHRANKEDAYNNQMREIEQLLEAMELTPELRSEDIFLRSAVYVNLRNGIEVTDINPQSGKIVRELVTPKAMQVELNQDSLKEHEKDVRIGLMAAFGVDEKTGVAAAKAVIEHIDDTIPAMPESIASILRAYNEGADITLGQMREVQQYMKEHFDLKGVGGFRALIEAFNYNELKTKGVPYTSNISVEVDGITNGFILMLAQLPVLGDSAAWLERGGIYLKGKYESFNEFINNGANTDSYQTIGKSMIESLKYYPKLKEFLDFFAGNIELDSSGKVPKVLRDLSKPAFMIYNYGASIARIGKDSREVVKDLIYNKIESIVQSNDIEGLKKLNQLLGTRLTMENALKSSKDLNNALFNLVDRKRKKNTPIREQNMGSQYAHIISSAVEETIGDIGEYRATIADTTKELWRMYDAALKSEQEKIFKQSGVEVSAAYVEAMAKRLEPLLPHYYSYNGRQGTKEFTPIFKPTYMVDADSNIQVSFAGTTFDGQTMSFTAQTLRRTLGDGGVSGAVMAVHAMDGAIMGKAYEAMSHKILGIHDAVTAGILDHVEASQQLNEATADIIEQYSMLEDYLRSAVESIKYAQDNGFIADSEISQSVGIALISLAGTTKIAQDSRKQLFDGKEIVVDQYPTLLGQGAITRKMKIEADNNLYEEALSISSELLSADVAQKDSAETLGSISTDFDINKAVEGETPVEVSGEGLTSLVERISAAIGEVIPADVKVMQDKLISNVLAPALNKLTPTYLKIKENVEEAGGNFGEIVGNNIIMVTGRDATTPHNSQSAGEVLLHELVHRITLEVLLNDGRARAELARIYKEAKKNAKWTDFLHRDEDGEVTYAVDRKAEAKHAQKIYDYIFNNPNMISLEGNVRVSVGMVEFVAYGLTNPNMVGLLKNTQTYKEAASKNIPFLDKRDGSVLTRVFNWLYNAFTKLIDKAVKAPEGSNLHDKLTDLVMDIASIKQKHVSRNQMALRAFARTTEKIIDTGNKVVTSVGKLAFGPLVRMTDMENYSKWPAVQAALMSLNLSRLRLAMYLHRNTKEQVEKTISDILKSKDPHKSLNAALQEQALTNSEGLVQTIMSTVRGDVTNKYDTVQRAFDRSRTMVDQTREMVRRTVSSEINNSFAEGTTRAQMESLTPVIVTSDLSTIVNDVGLETTREFLSNPAKLKEYQSNKLSEIAVHMPADFNSVKLQADGLGVFLATGVATVPMLVTNIEGILDGIHRGDRRHQSPEDRESAYNAISEYVSAVALESIPAEVKKTASKVWDAEFAANTKFNGITTSLRWQEAARKDSESRIFGKGNYHMAKGYTPTLTDPNKEFRIARKDDAAALREDGWKPMMEISNTDIGAVDSDALQFYIRETTAAAGFTQGAFDITSRGRAGTSVTDALMIKDGEVKTSELKGTVGRLAETFEKDLQETLRTGKTARKSYPVPVFDLDGNVVDFSYRINTANRKTLLNQNFVISDVLSEYAASTEGKANTGGVNIDTVKALKQDFDNNFKTNPDNFIWINGGEYSADGTTNKFRESFMRIPPEAREMIKDIWGNMGIPVRKNMARIVMGGSRYSIVDSGIVSGLQNMFPMLKDSAKFRNFLAISEKVWQEIVQLAKVGIVIKTPIVVLINMVSNYMLQAVNLVDPITASRDYIEGIRELRAFEKISQQEVIAKSKIRTAKTERERKNAIQELIEIRHYKDASPIKPLLEEGMFQSIVEELDTTKHGYIEKMGERLYERMENKFGKKMTDRLTLVPRHLLMTQTSATYKFLNKVTQYSDFVARYSYVKRETMRNERRAADAKKPLSQIYKEAKALFINYKLPDHKGLEYLNAMGGVLFTKYYLGIQHVVAKLWMDQPIEAIASALGQQILGDISDIYDDSIVNKSPLNLFLNPMDHIDAATKLYGWQFWGSIL